MMARKLIGDVVEGSTHVGYCVPSAADRSAGIGW